ASGKGGSQTYTADMSALAAGARQEIRLRGAALSQARGSAADRAVDAHRLAGLAGQFGAMNVAAAAAGLELALTGAGDAGGGALRALDAALAAFEGA
ncbi:MAG: hypothetical protein ABI655_08615, partial [Phenylobacterium sp.]